MLPLSSRSRVSRVRDVTGMRATVVVSTFAGPRMRASRSLGGHKTSLVSLLDAHRVLVVGELRRPWPIGKRHRQAPTSSLRR